jgi:uncharacterized protein (DUF58 family)
MAKRKQGAIELTARGRLCLILLHLTAGAAWLTGDDNARLAASVLAAPFLVDLLFKALRAPRLGLTLAPRRTEAGATFVESFELANQTTVRAAAALRVSEPRTATPAGAAFVATLAPGATILARLASRSRRRGRIEERSFTVDSHWPLGMFRWHATLTVVAELITEPARVPLDPEILAALEAGREDPRPDRQIDGREFFALREYRSGEDARHVHARRSASLGVLVTKVFRLRREPECSLVLDLRRQPGTPPSINNRPFERCLGITASLCDELVARNARLRCLVLDGDVREWRVECASTAREFLAFLAVVQSVPYRPLAKSLSTLLASNEQCFWIPAGGHLRAAERQSLDAVHVLEGRAS